MTYLKNSLRGPPQSSACSPTNITRGILVQGKLQLESASLALCSNFLRETNTETCSLALRCMCWNSLSKELTSMSSCWRDVNTALCCLSALSKVYVRCVCHNKDNYHWWVSAWIWKVTVGRSQPVPLLCRNRWRREWWWESICIHDWR